MRCSRSRSERLADLADRAEAIHEVRPTADFEPLAASFKRIKNILKQAEVECTRAVEARIARRRDPRAELYEAFDRVRARRTQSSDTYAAKLASIASLRPQVDLFFDKIL